MTTPVHALSPIAASWLDSSGVGGPGSGALGAGVPEAATTTVGTAPAAPASAAGTAAVLALVGVLVAALIAAAWNVWAVRRKAKEEERTRQRMTFADAFKSYSLYKEFPYAIRRRRPDKAAEERVRLSEQLRVIQADLTFHQTWMDLEDTAVADAYRDMVGAARTLAGGLMNAAWKDPAVSRDCDMNISRELVDLSPLTTKEQRYRDAVQLHLDSITRSWLSRMRERLAALA